MADITSPLWGNTTQYYLSRHKEQLYDQPAGFDCNWYDYVASYCMEWGPAVCYHPGIDVSMQYGTTLYAPAAGIITCAGPAPGGGYDGAGCAAYPDYGPNGWGPAGVGRVELVLDDGTVLIYGHCSSALAPSGTRVQAGDPIATSGFMASDHLHFEVRVPNGSCVLDYAIVDPTTFPWFTGTVDSGPFLVGDKIEVVSEDGLNLRSEPSTAGGQATVIKRLPNRTKLDVLDGPTEADDFHWYNVKVASGGGWGWRDIGPTTVAVWGHELRNITNQGSPMLSEAEACHAAAREHSTLALAMAWVEQKYGTYQAVIPASYHNPMSLRSGAGGWQQFPTYAAGITAWYNLLTDPDFLYADTTTVAELIHIYAPNSDLPGQEEKYVREIEQMVARYRELEEDSAGEWRGGRGAWHDRLRRGRVVPAVEPLPGWRPDPSLRRTTKRPRSTIGLERSCRSVSDRHRDLRPGRSGLCRKPRVVPGRRVWHHGLGRRRILQHPHSRRVRVVRKECRGAP